MGKKLHGEAIIQRLQYSSGLVRIEKLIQQVCQWLGVCDEKHALDLIQDGINRGVLSHTPVEFTEEDPVTGLVHTKVKHLINQGYREVNKQQNGLYRPQKLLTNFDALRHRAETCDPGLPPRMKNLIDRCSTHKYRFNPTMLEIMQKITIPNHGGSKHDQRRLMQEALLMQSNGCTDFAQLLETEMRRFRLHVKGAAGMSYQSSSLFRACIEASTGSRVGAKSFEFMKHVIGEGYDLTVEKADDIRAAGESFFTNPEKFGYSVTDELATVFVQAEALSKASWGEEVHTLGRLDHTCSGYQIMAIKFGCAILAKATNLTDRERQDLYNAVLTLASCPPQFAEWTAELFIRTLSKFMVIRGGYGSSATGLTRGLLLHDPASDLATEMFDHNGILSSKAIETFTGPNRSQILNRDWGHIWLQCAGKATADKPRARWDILVDGIRELSRSFEHAIYALSPRLQEGKQLVQKAADNVIKSGKVLSYTTFMGAEYKLFSPEFNWEEPTRRHVRKYRDSVTGDGKLDCYLRPMHNNVRVTQALVDQVHNDDSAIDQRGKELFFDAVGWDNPMCITGDVHDCIAALYEYLPERLECQKKSVHDVAPSIVKGYVDILAQGKVDDPEKHHNRVWNRDQIFQCKHFCTT